MKKMSLANVISKLTRKEMRSIMAGSGTCYGGQPNCESTCIWSSDGKTGVCSNCCIA